MSTYSVLEFPYLNIVDDDKTLEEHTLIFKDCVIFSFKNEAFYFYYSSSNSNKK